MITLKTGGQIVPYRSSHRNSKRAVRFQGKTKNRTEENCYERPTATVRDSFRPHSIIEQRPEKERSLLQFLFWTELIGMTTFFITIVFLGQHGQGRIVDPPAETQDQMQRRFFL